MSAFCWKKLLSARQKGQALPEYATTLALITLFCLAALAFFGRSISEALLSASGHIQSLPIGGF